MGAENEKEHDGFEIDHRPVAKRHREAGKHGGAERGRARPETTGNQEPKQNRARKRTTNRNGPRSTLMLAKERKHGGNPKVQQRRVVEIIPGVGNRQRAEIKRGGGSLRLDQSRPQNIVRGLRPDRAVKIDLIDPRTVDLIGQNGGEDKKDRSERQKTQRARSDCMRDHDTLFI